MLDVQSLLWIACSCVFALLGLLLVQVLGSGILKKLSVQRVKLGPFIALYEDYQGPYRSVGPVFDRVVRQIANTDLVEETQTVKTAGFYFDDPAKVAAALCRASICCIVHEGLDGLDQAKAKLEQHDVVQLGGLKVGVFPESECICVEFPFYSRWSIFIAVMRCYPLLQKACRGLSPQEQSNVLGSMELYCCDEQYMLFTFPLTRRTDFQPFDVKKAV